MIININFLFDFFVENIYIKKSKQRVKICFFMRISIIEWPECRRKTCIKDF